MKINIKIAIPLALTIGAAALILIFTTKERHSFSQYKTTELYRSEFYQMLSVRYRNGKNSVLDDLSSGEFKITSAVGMLVGSKKYNDYVESVVKDSIAKKIFDSQEVRNEIIKVITRHNRECEIKDEKDINIPYLTIDEFHSMELADNAAWDAITHSSLFVPGPLLEKTGEALVHKLIKIGSPSRIILETELDSHFSLIITTYSNILKYNLDSQRK